MNNYQPSTNNNTYNKDKEYNNYGNSLKPFRISSSRKPFLHIVLQLLFDSVLITDLHSAVPSHSKIMTQL